MAQTKRYVIYFGNVVANYSNGQSTSGTSDSDIISFKTLAENSLGIYIKTPAQVMQFMRYELFLVNPSLAENLSGVFSVPNLGWNPTMQVITRTYQWSEVTSSKTPYQSSIGSYASDMTTNANMKSGYTLPADGVCEIRWAQLFVFSMDDSNYDLLAADADGEHIFTENMVWFWTYGLQMFSRTAFPEMIDPIDPYEVWWTNENQQAPKRFDFPKMHDYSKVESNIFVGSQKIKDFYVGDEKVKRIYLGDKKVMG